MTVEVDSDVLVVDDDPLVLMLVGRRLKNSGLTLKACHSGQEALEYLRLASVRLLLVDLYMEPMGGVEFLEAVDSEKRRGSSRAFLATSSTPCSLVMEQLERLRVSLVMKECVLENGGIARLLDTACDDPVRT